MANDQTGEGQNGPQDDAAHLLLIDDDRRIRSLMSRYLTRIGYRVTTAADAAQARRHLEVFTFDMMIVDVMMPGESGLDFVTWLRSHSQVPVLLLTARAEAEDRIAGLETGADDYLTKPFEPRELSLRIASILRRAAPAPAPTTPQVIRFGPFLFHVERGELRNGEETVRLTERERSMLQMLARTPGEPVTREELAGPLESSNERTIDVHINRLRRKIERDPANPLFLQTARGSGYRIVTEA
ncbi:MAG: response regulator transcription factor [Hyphomicrobiales bacterium]|nr:response regulator transcription factor [Hyphomicrobiales bacterium]